MGRPQVAPAAREPERCGSGIVAADEIRNGELRGVSLKSGAECVETRSSTTAAHLRFKSRWRQSDQPSTSIVLLREL